MRIVKDYARYASFMPTIRVSRVLSQRGDSAIMYVEGRIVKGTIGLWAQLKIGPRASDARTQVVEATMMKGNMDLMEVRWEVTPIDAQRARVAFQLLVDLKFPFPASLVSNENVKGARRTVQALRRVLTR